MPANPVKAKKAAAARAAKENKSKKMVAFASDQTEETERKPNAPKWSSGKYGNNPDGLFMLSNIIGIIALSWYGGWWTGGHKVKFIYYMNLVRALSKAFTCTLFF